MVFKAKKVLKIQKKKKYITYTKLNAYFGHKNFTGNCVNIIYIYFVDKGLHSIKHKNQYFSSVTTHIK
jgi:hypothetical protein